MMSRRNFVRQEGLDNGDPDGFRRAFRRWSVRSHPDKVGAIDDPYLRQAALEYATRRFRNMATIADSGFDGPNINVHPDPRVNLPGWANANPDLNFVAAQRQAEDRAMRRQAVLNRHPGHLEYAAESDALRMAREMANYNRYERVRVRARQRFREDQNWRYAHRVAGIPIPKRRRRSRSPTGRRRRRSRSRSPHRKAKRRARNH